MKKPDHVIIFDTTLRDGEQCPGASMGLHEKLQELVRRQVSHCCGPSEIEEEAAAEWRQLGQYLAEHGGLEAAIQRAYELLDPTQTKQRDEAAMSRTLTRIVPLSRPSSEDGGR